MRTHTQVFCLALAIAQTIADDTQEQPMASLVIDLQDGFSEDTVIIGVDGREVFNKKGVTTDYAIGRADSVQAQTRQGLVDVEVNVPSRSVSKTIAIEVSNTVYLGISILEHTIDYRISDERFVYF